ncbi:MAG: serine/threonine protein kinase, partial [Myxococcales bacterium]|nr:serine/threonine protein kinase [Myxococcales bacterium]
MASTEPDIIGRVLGGRYTVDALIGRGGFGAVYRGTHLRLGDTVAIKIITDPPPDLSARFHREAKVQRRLRHPVTVRLLDLDVEADGLHYMVQEYVDGRTLKTVLRDEGPLAPWRLVALMIAVLDALDEAHALGIIHRDLKPENIMVVDGRGGEEARLLDFGIAKLRDRDASDETLTAQGMVLGTLAYMAPEQVVRGPLGPPTDVYQLGAVMYRLLSGRKPFTGTAQDVLRQHLAAPPPPLPALVPPPLAAVVMRAMEKDQAHRFATAQAMRDALVAARAAILQTSPAVPRLDLGDSLSGSLPPAAVASEPSGSSSLLHPRGELDEAPALRLAVTRPRQIAALTAVAALLALGVVAAAWWRFDRGADTDEAERIIVGAAPQAAGQGRGAAAAAPVDGIDVIGADVIGAIDAIKGIGA